MRMPRIASPSSAPHAHGQDLRTAGMSQVTGPRGGWVRQGWASQPASLRQEPKAALAYSPEAGPRAAGNLRPETTLRTIWIRRSGSKCRATSVRPGRKRRTGTAKRTRRTVSMGGVSCFRADGVSVCACHCPLRIMVRIHIRELGVGVAVRWD